MVSCPPVLGNVKFGEERCRRPSKGDEPLVRRSVGQSVTQWLGLFGTDFGIDLPPFRKVWPLRPEGLEPERGVGPPGKWLLRQEEMQKVEKGTFTSFQWFCSLLLCS